MTDLRTVCATVCWFRVNETHATICFKIKIMINFVGKAVKIEEAESSETQYRYWVNTGLCKTSYLVRAHNMAEFQENYQAEYYSG